MEGWKDCTVSWLIAPKVNPGSRMTSVLANGGVTMRTCGSLPYVILLYDGCQWYRREYESMRIVMMLMMPYARPLLVSSDQPQLLSERFWCGRAGV